MASNPSSALLAALSVEVGVDLTKLMRGLAEGKQAVDRFNRSATVSSGAGGSDQTATSAANAQRTIESLRRTVERASSTTQKMGADAAAASRDVDRLSGSSDKTRLKLEEARRATERFGSSVVTAGRDVEAAGRNMQGSLETVKRTLLQTGAVVAGAFGVNKLKEMADDYVTFTNRIRSAGVEGERLTNVQEQLYGIGQRYGVQLTGLGTLYGRITQAQRELGASDADVMKATEGSAAALRLYGAGTAEARGALTQFSQLLGGTRVQMQEFNSINDGARPILQAVANGIDRFGGSISKLRAEVLSDNGLSVKEFFQGYLRGIDSIERKAQDLPFTLSQSFEVLTNALTRYTGETDKALGISQFFGTVIRAIGENLNIIMPALSAIVVIIGTRMVAALGASAFAWLRNTAVMAAHAVATNSLSAAQLGLSVMMGRTGVSSLAAAAGVSRLSIVMATATTGAARLGAGLLAALGGWVGAAILAIIGSVYLFTQASNQATEAESKFEETKRRNNEAINEGNRLLTDASARAGQAQSATSQLNNATQTGTTFMQRFAGATGDAANALYQQAIQARNARVEMLRLQAQQATTQATEASAQARQYEGGSLFGGGWNPFGPAADEGKAREWSGRASGLQHDAFVMNQQADQLANTPPESWVSPNQATGGRNLPAEIAQLRENLAAVRGNRAAQTEVLRRLRIAERAQALVSENHVPIDIATGQAEAEHQPARAPRTPLSQGQRDDRSDASYQHRLAREPWSNETAAFIMANEGRPELGGWNMLAYNQRDPRTGRLTNAAHVPQADLEGMTIRQVREWQRTVMKPLTRGHRGPNDPGSTGVGPFQLEGSSIDFAGPRALGENWLDQRFSPENQMRLAKARFEEAQRTHSLPTTWAAFGPGRHRRGDTDAVQNMTQDVTNQHQQEDRFRQGMETAQDAILSATQEQSTSATASLEFERRRINIERDRQKADIARQATDGELTAAAATTLTETNEQLRTLQLHGVDLKEQQQLSEELAQRAQRRYELSQSQLEIERDIARTATARRAVERRILVAQEAYERQRLQALIDNPNTSPGDREQARGQLEGLGTRFQGERTKLNRQAQEDVWNSAPDGSESARRRQRDQVGEQREERLAVIQEAVDAELITEEEAAQRRIEIEADANRQIAELEAARWQTSISAARQSTQAVMDVLKQFFGEQSAVYKAAFIADKAFAIAEAIINIQLGVAKAAALPFPANIPAIASVIAATASIVSNIAAVGAQFDTGGWTGDGPRGMAAGTVHGQEFVVRAGPAAQHRQMLEGINAGRDPTAGFRASGGPSAGRGRVNVSQMPGVAIEVRENMTTGDVDIIARRAVEKHAAGVVAADMDRPNGKTRKAIQRNTSARPRKS